MIFKRFTMLRVFLLCQVLALVLCASVEKFKVEIGPDQTPQHVHIAYGDLPSKIIVTWSTPKTAPSQVIYGLDYEKLFMMQNGSSEILVNGGAHYQYIHRVDLSGLKANTTYFYKVGSQEAWSQTFMFKTMPDGVNWGPKLAVFGDMGATNAQSLPRLEMDAALGKFDAVLHVGDFGYNLDSADGTVGDSFMEQIEGLAASVPYMTCPGNHEHYLKFSNYLKRFNMPNDNKKMYYSFNMGPVHFVSISTELAYYAYENPALFPKIFEQYDWLKKDLTEANKDRSIRPWIVVFGHRPMFCSNSNKDDCVYEDCLIRVGVPKMKIKGLEPLLYDQGVDMAIWAHEHSYERMWPTYNLEVKNGSVEAPYTNPGGITHIITGSAGCLEKHDPFGTKFGNWSAFHSSDYGYTRMNFMNTTHLYVEQVSDDQNGKIIDNFTLIRDNHGPYELEKKEETTTERPLL